MCQPKEKGGRRCPTHQPASIGLKKFMVEDYGLLPEQIEHTFRGLREAGANRSAPTMEQYAAFIEKTKRKMNNSPRLDDKAKRSINRQLDKELTESELPDAATFYALQKLQARSREQKREFVGLIKNLAQHRGTNRNEALAAFKEKYAEMDEKYKSDFSNDFDGRTDAVFAALTGREDSSSGVPEFSTEPRITREPVQHSSYLSSIGYDPDDGRLEVELQNGNVYAYHNVPMYLWNDIQANPGPTISRAIFHGNRGGQYSYESQEAAQADAVGRYCEDCHQYRAISGHVCDYSAAEARETVEVASEEEIESLRQLIEEDDVPDPEDSERAENTEASGKPSVEEALARIRASLGSTEAPEQESSRRQRAPRTGPSARQRRWAIPLEEREIVNLDGAETSRVNNRNGWRDWNQAIGPKHTAFRKEVIQKGNIVEFNLSHEGKSVWDHEALRSTEGNVQQRFKAYVDNQDGKIIFERIGRPKCTCEVFQRNGTCKHLSWTFNTHNRREEEIENLRELREEETNSVFETALNTYHKTLDKSSYLRSQSEEGGPIQITRTGRSRRARYINSRIGLYNNLTAADWRNARNLLDQGETIEVILEDVRYYDRSFGEYHIGNAEVVMKKEEGEYKIASKVFRCGRCGRNEETCPHTEVVSNLALQGLNGELNRSRTTTVNADNTDYANLDTAERLSKLNEEINNEWSADAASVETMRVFSPRSGVDHSYSANLDQYIADVREAEAKISNGENPLPFVKENATNGVCAPETGRGFGVELEFVLPQGVSSHTVGEAIARDLYREGLSDISYKTGYHGYSGNRWHIEYDCSVDGEVVSPVLHDTPEHWEELQKVCDIIKRHGGKTSAKTGGHVHMGLGRGETAEVERRKVATTQLFAAYQDSILRVHASKERKKHRDSEYCSPLTENSAQSSIYSLRTSGYGAGGHYTSFNLAHRGRIEFRGADGSLDPAEIQANVMVAAGMVSAAERGELEGQTLKVSKIGTNAKKMKLISKGERTKPKTDDELIVSDIEFRNFTDTFLNYEHGRKMMAGVAAINPWQETRQII